MKILIVGLGLIGGAYAKKLTELGHIVYGSNHRQKSIDFAIENKYIKEGNIDPTNYIKNVNLIILGTYPSHILDFINKYKHLFTKDLVITDVCGVKSKYLLEATNNSLPATYLSHHPMAGREKKGIEFSHLVSFDQANYIITTVNNYKYSDYAYNMINNLGVELGFKNIKELNYLDHDFMIGYTSQLAHAIAVSLVNSDTKENTKYFIGDSYRDLTRIAMINEVMWTELFLENKDFLIQNIDNFMNELQKIRDAIKNNDTETLKELFIKSTNRRKEMI